MRSVITVLVVLLIVGSVRADWPQLEGRNIERQAELAKRLNTLRDDRPRLFYTEDDIKALRARIPQHESLQEVQGWLMEWAGTGHFYENLWATPDQLIAISVAYRLSDRDPRIARHAEKIADFLIEAKGDSWTWPRIAKGLAVYYDWFYDDLTPERRKKVGEAALHAARQCYSTWRHTDFNNHSYLEYGPILYVGLALRDEGIHDADAQQLLLDALNLIYDHFIPAHQLINAGSGGWPEGMQYHGFFAYEFAQVLAALDKAGGHPIWENFRGFDGNGEWLMRGRRPFDNARVAIGDVKNRNAVGLELARYLPLQVHGPRDRWARWYLDDMKEEAKRRDADGNRYIRHGSSWWPYLLWFDPAVEPIDRDTQPLARHFTGIGWATMRSDWTSNATFAVLHCPPVHTGGHQQADYNHFAIHHKGRLAIDSGHYESGPHRANYYARSIAHNTILVHDPDEQFRSGAWGGGKFGNSENDGGQRFTFGPHRITDIDDTWRFGRITTFQNDDRATITIGDATKAYQGDKVREFQRAFIFMRPNVFVVFDRVESSDASFAKTWLLHTVNQPKVNQETRHTVITDQEGSLTLQTLLPKQTAQTLVGGEGREFEVNGTNYPPQTQYDADEAGRWRIEVRPTQPAKRDYFLHVLATGDADQPITPTTQVIDSEHAVQLIVTINHESWRLIFNKNGELNPQVQPLKPNPGEFNFEAQRQ